MKKFILTFVYTILVFCINAQQYTIVSPDNSLKAEIENANAIKVVLLQKEKPVLSFTDIKLESTRPVNSNVPQKIKKISRHSVSEEISPVIQEKSKNYTNCYNELTLHLKTGEALTFRLFNEGLAYRFSTSQKDSLVITRETLNIQLSETDSIRFQASSSFNSSYETPYEFKKISGITNETLCHLPALVQKEDGPFILITESDLYNYPGLWMKGTGTNQLQAIHPPFPKKLSWQGDIYGHGQITETCNFIAKVKGTRNYPWRLFAVCNNEAELIDNNLVYMLASPTQMDDLSWIKPGVVMFDWWGKNNIYGVNFKAGVNTETAKYYIDFCAAHGFRYFLFDDGWSQKDDLLHEVPELNMAEVTAYARSKGVDIMLWVIWHALEKQWDQAFDQFEKWGIKGIKMDFMNRDDQQMVEFYEAVAQKAAEKKMVVNFHGAYKPCGLRRKYPNVLTREALIEFEYNGWTKHDTPEHHNLLPYIRMATGPMDYIPGTLRNSTKDNFRPVGDYPMGQGTRAHSMALFVILSGPMEMLPDSPSDYYREKECTDFLASIPVEWDETRLLDGKIADYTILARRSGSDWYIGAITDENERSLEIDTKFLSPGNYSIEMIQDGANANSRAEDYQKVESVIQAGEKLKIHLARGGGWIARLRISK